MLTPCNSSEDAKEEESVAQIVNDALEQCEKGITTVANTGGDAIRLSGDLVEESYRAPNRTKWLIVRKTVWRGYVTIRMNNSNTLVQM